VFCKKEKVWGLILWLIILLKSKVIIQMMTVDRDNFREKLLPYLNQYLYDIQDSEGNWTVKGFIDIFKNVSRFLSIQR